MIEEERATVLIVDDEKSNLMILAEILKDKYKVVLAKNGRQAIERAIKQSPDLILLDIVMPEMDGYQVLYEFKSNDALKDIPVIFISALHHHADEEKGLVMGAVDYISKPFSHPIVLARVNNHIKIVRQIKLIESIALLDGLTGIPNRRNYENRIDMEWSRAVREKTPFSLLFLDIDYFKYFNDNYGHSKGDEALKAVANNIYRSIRRPADFAARTGGEEFGVLLPNTEKGGALQRAEKIRASIEDLRIPHEYSAVSAVLTISIGGTCCLPDRESDIQEFIDEADKMLYRAKNYGGNRVIFE